MGMMVGYPHLFDVSLCGVTVKNVALTLPLVGHPWTMT